MERKLLVTDGNSVPCVIPTLVSDDVINLISQEIRCFTFSLIAPLGAKENYCGHCERLSDGHQIQRFAHIYELGSRACDPGTIQLDRGNR